MVEVYYKAVYDALLWNASRLEAVLGYYQTLLNSVDDYMVINKVREDEGAPKNQRINITTYFGPGAGQSLDVKTFYFDKGSTLLYWKEIGADNHDPFEVMNYGSVVAMISSLSSLSPTGEYIPHTNRVVYGSYSFTGGVQTFSRPQTDRTATDDDDLVNEKHLTDVLKAQSFLKKTGDTGLGDYTFASGTVFIDRAKVTHSPSEENDVVTLGFMAQGTLTDPYFESGPIFVSANPATIEGAGGEYTDINSGMTAWRVKILTSDDWETRFGDMHALIRGGQSLGSADTIPNPLRYRLYLRLDDNSYSSNRGSVGIIPIDQSQLPHWVYVDDEGDLALGIYTPDTPNIRVPWLMNTTITAVMENLTLRFYVIVDKWTYHLPGDLP